MTELEKINEYLFKKYEKLIFYKNVPSEFVNHDVENDKSINIVDVINKYRYGNNGLTTNYDIDNFYLKLIRQSFNKKVYFDETLKPLIKIIYDSKNNKIPNQSLINEIVVIIQKEEQEKLELLKKEEEEKKMKVIKKEVVKEVNKTSKQSKTDVKKNEKIKDIITDDNDKKKKKKPISATIKRLVWNTNIGEDVGKSKCMCCNSTDISQMSFNCGHIVAEANGGDTIVSNLKPICQNCNSSMGIKNMDEFMKSLK